MKILLVESDGFERQIADTDIRTLIQGDVVFLDDCGKLLDLVQEGSDLGGADVLVIEHYLPLCTTADSLQDLDERIEQLRADFPEVVTVVADGRSLGEKAIRWMRSVGVQVPIVIHTHSMRSRIARDVLELSGVSYCYKSLSRNTLCDAITAAVQAR